MVVEVSHVCTLKTRSREFQYPLFYTNMDKRFSNLKKECPIVQQGQWQSKGYLPETADKARDAVSN